MSSMKKVHTLVIGSGAAGLCAAVRLKAEGINDILIVTEGLDQGTSINTGSDKQTYYKLSLCGGETDSPFEMAQTLFNGGAMHGDIALTEAALSARTFFHLLNLGVPFPTDKYGQYAGYKTDHDPRQRATSVGPYTSREMCTVLIKRVKELQIPVQEHFYCVELLAQKERVCGAIFVDSDDNLVPVIAENVVFAVGGPGGLYEHSVYPQCHTGSIGLALAIGAEACNLAESQFGLASTGFRWNVSGTYMQVIPRFVSTDLDGNDEKEFLLDYYDTPGELYSSVFLKGYQWPFDTKKLRSGSSLIDLLVYIETVEKRRRVFLDYRKEPKKMDFAALSTEAKQYLEKSQSLKDSPLERLEIMNPAAIQLYADNGIDLSREMLEIAVCAQHNNGGLAGTIWWESTNIKHLFPIGEVNGSHGVARPGGAALNAGQVGAFRAAQYIANRYDNWTIDVDSVTEIAQERIRLLSQSPEPMPQQVSSEALKEIQHRMTAYGGMIRSEELLDDALGEARKQFALLPRSVPQETLKVWQLCLAHYAYLTAIRQSISTGSRGSALVLTKEKERGVPIHPQLDTEKWTMLTGEETSPREIQTLRFVREENKFLLDRQPVRPIPQDEVWFETTWKEHREKEIYQ